MSLLNNDQLQTKIATLSGTMTQPSDAVLELKRSMGEMNKRDKGKSQVQEGEASMPPPPLQTPSQHLHHQTPPIHTPAPTLHTPAQPTHTFIPPPPQHPLQNHPPQNHPLPGFPQNIPMPNQQIRLRPDLANPYFYRNAEPNMWAGRNLRLDFPHFNGDNPRNWLRKCHRFFMVNPMAEHEKVILASMHLEGKAEYWYVDYVEGREHMGWNMFVAMVMDRFEEEERENLVGDFNKLKQDGSVESYKIQFEQLKAFVLQNNRGLTEDYFVKSFLSGLKDEIRSMVMMMRPLTVNQAVHSAKMQERSMNQLNKGMRTKFRSATSNLKGFKPNTEYVSKVGNYEPRSSSSRRFTPEEIEERKKKGLCFHCDEKYIYGHKCKRLFNIEGAEIDEETEENEAEPDQTEPQDENVQVSLHALTGCLAPKTIKIKGRVKKNEITILIDTGSTNTFLDTITARNLKCVVECTTGIMVTVA